MQVKEMNKKVKKGDMVEIVYEGYILNNMDLFDTNIKEVAERHGKYSEKINFEPISIIIGEGMVIKGLDKALENKEIGKEYEIIIPPEEGFGKYNPSKIKVVSLSLFKKEKINPYPGMVITFSDGSKGKVLSISSGRVKIDFNHELAGKDLLYKFRIIRKIVDMKEKIRELIKYFTGIKIDESKIEYNNKTKELRISEEYKSLKEILDQIVNQFIGKDVKKIEFVKLETKRENDQKKEP